MPSPEPLDERCGARCRDGGFCTQWPVQGSSRCKMHGGLTPTKDENPNVGAPDGSTNAKSHGLYMKRDGYIERQSDEDQEWILELTESLIDMWRARHQGKPPKAIRSRLESIAIDMHRVSHANAYVADEGLTQIRQEVVGDETINSEKLTLWSSETRHYNDSIERRLDKHGLLDPPEDRGGGGPRVYESEDYRIEVGEDVDFDDPDASEKYTTTFVDSSSDPDADDEPDE